MKRLKVILALALALGMMVTISVAPALANNNNNNNDNRLDRHDLRVDRQILHNLNNDDNDCCDDFDHNDNFDNFDHNDNFFFDGFGFISDCPFAGDHSGVVTESDCFD